MGKGIFSGKSFIRFFDEEMISLSSAPHNGGLRVAEGFFFMYVDKNYSGDYKHDCRKFEEENKLRNFVGFMSAVEIPEVLSEYRKDFLEVYVTAGVTNPAIAGEKAKWNIGTVNIAIIIKKGLRVNAMVNAVMTATEAKTRVMLERYNATGTTSDGIGVFSFPGSEEWAGTSTELGYEIGRGVVRALEESLSKWEKML